MITKPLVNITRSVLMEYENLRTEINTRITIMYQIFAFTLAADSVILTVGFNSGGNTRLILIYPYVSFFASIIYLSNISVIQNIGKYIKDVIEPVLDTQYRHWEETIQEHPRYGYHFYYFAAGLTMFTITPSLVLLAYIRYVPQFQANLFFYPAILLILITLILMCHSFQMIYPQFYRFFFRKNDNKQQEYCPNCEHRRRQA